MDEIFRQHIKCVVAKFDSLVSSAAFHYPLPPKVIPDSGVYLFSENKKHLYVGRSDSIRKRLNTHQRESAKVNSAAFAALIAKSDCGIVQVSYTAAAPGAHYSDRADFKNAFQRAKNRIRQMDIRVVAENDPVCQALLELYAASVLKTPFNDFSNH